MGSQNSPHMEYYAPPPDQDILPDHENTPAYSEDTYQTPLLTYHLRDTKLNTSHLVPFGPAAYGPNLPSYEIQYRSSIALPIFNRKGDIRLFRITSSASTPTPVARADFHSDGPLPYHPRARFSLHNATEYGRGTVVEMGAPGFETWTFDFDSMPYTWAFRPIPACLELSSSQSASTPVIARFTYGKVGTKVLPGGEVGHLEIWRDRLTEDAEGIEAVITGCLVVVKYFDNIGRKYRNDGSGGSAAASLINAKGRETTSVRGRIACI